MPLFGGLRRRLSRGTRRPRFRPEPTVNVVVQQEDRVDPNGSTTSSSFKPPSHVTVHAVPAGRLSPISVAEDSIFSLPVNNNNNHNNKIPLVLHDSSPASQQYFSERVSFVVEEENDRVNQDDDDSTYIPETEQATLAQQNNDHDEADNLIQDEEDSTIVSMRTFTKQQQQQQQSPPLQTTTDAAMTHDGAGAVPSRVQRPTQFPTRPTTTTASRPPLSTISNRSGSTTSRNEWKSSESKLSNSETILDSEPEAEDRKERKRKANNIVENDTFKLQDRVLIVRGKKNKKTGTIVGWGKNGLVKVLLDGGGDASVRKTSLQLLKPTIPADGASEGGISSQNHSYTGAKVFIEKGLNKNKSGTVLGWKKKGTLNVQLDNGGKPIGVQLSSVRFLESEGHEMKEPDTPPNPKGNRTAPNRKKAPNRQTCANSNNDHTVRSERSLAMFWRSINDRARSRPFQGPGNLISVFGGKSVKIREGDEPNPSFLEHMLPGRIIEVTQKLASKKTFPRSRVLEAREYELFSIKIDDDTGGNSAFGVRSKIAKLVYVDVSPCEDGTPFSVQDFLLRFGDFSALDPRKIMARLELFQSPARFEVQQFDRSHFCEIKENGNVGCGFIASHLLEKICNRGGVKHAELITAIQVRLFIPSLGIFKGMLQKKDIPSGDPGIQLPPSMKKVPASTIADVSSPAYLVVCQGGLHTSFGGMNDYIGRKFAGTLKAHKTFARQIKTKKLKDMVLTLWNSLGVPEHELKRYAKESLEPDRHSHAWVVGTADPTGALPPDHVFVPGMGKAQPEKIFVTRSPCLRHDHGRLLPSVTTQPRDMSLADWEFLNSHPFGSVIFSRPRAGSMSMPERIASGDLDGDLYLICWDFALLSCMNNVDAMVDQPIEDDGVLKTVPSNSRWLEEARDVMTNVTAFADIGALIGKLYTKSMKVAKESKLKKEDPDAAALAVAFNEALEYKKHGRPIRLPSDLIDQMPKKLRYLLTPL